MAKITVTKDRYTAESLYQWDVGQVLKIYGLSLARVPEIHFKNSAMDRAIVKQATMSKTGIITASVPNSLLQKPYNITAYVCIWENGTFSTEYKVEIPVIARAKPNDYTLEADDDEIYSFNALENTVNNMLYVLDGYSDEFEKTIAETQRIADEAKANKHASNHFSGGSDPITPANIGAAEYTDAGVLFENGVVKTVGGKTIDFSRIATGSYEGAGTGGYGLTNSLTLTFDFVPKLVFIYRTTTPSVGHNMVMLHENTRTITINAGSSSWNDCEVVWVNNAVSWYYPSLGGDTDDRNAWAYNIPGETYHYVAIG